jgi:pantothenate kinase
VITTFEAALDVVVEDVATLLAEGAVRALVGITGPPGVGKSTFAEALADRLGAAYVPMDGFHLSNAQLDRLGRRIRKGAMDTFDVDGYVALLERIATAVGDIYVPGFDRTLEEPVAATHVVPDDARVVVTEGNYLCGRARLARGTPTAAPALLPGCPTRAAPRTAGGSAYRRRSRSGRRARLCRRGGRAQCGVDRPQSCEV